MKTLQLRVLFKYLLFALLFVVLTIVTQIGGIVLLVSYSLSRIWKQQFRFKQVIVFVALYLICTFLLVPQIAPIFGREKIRASNTLQPATYFTVLLNRNYVTKDLNTVLGELSSKRTLNYLDGNFPFIDNFPLLPHLSHNDGKKIDLSFIYEDVNGNPTTLLKSNSGYGVFEGPKLYEIDQISKCKNLGHFQYDFPKYLTFGEKNKTLTFSIEANKALLNEIVQMSSVEKVFIEPHLKTRMQLTSNKIRYHGCRAVRHDDHIHIQVK